MNCKTCSGPCCLKGSNHEGDCEGYKPMTNADRIRAMSDEELAGWLDQIDGVGMFPGQTQWLDWLRQEADHE